MILPRLHLTACALVASALAAPGAILLSTDFSGRSVAGKTANDVVWTSNGLSAPSSLTAVDEAPTSGAFSALFDTASSQGHFAPDKNIGNEGPWSATIPVTLTTPQVSLESVDIDWQHFTNSGTLQGPARGVRWTVTVTGSLSGLLANGTASASADAVSGINNVAFAAPLALDNSETYDIRIFVENNGNTIGNNTGFDGLSFNGEVIPEPSSLSMLGLGIFGLILRRRR